MKKAGRPATGLENPKNINFRWTEEGSRLIDLCAENAGLSRAEYERQLHMRDAKRRKVL